MGAIPIAHRMINVNGKAVKRRIRGVRNAMVLPGVDGVIAATRLENLDYSARV
jgi:hypothetical protein